jgi:hypothetical protein
MGHRKNLLGGNVFWPDIKRLNSEFTYVPSASWSMICGWGHHQSKEPVHEFSIFIFPLFPRCDFLCGGIGAPLFFNASIISLSFKLVRLVWGISFYALRAQWTSTSAVGTSSIAYWQICRSLIVLPHTIEWSNQPNEARMRNFGLKPRNVWSQSDRLPADGEIISENTSKPLRCYFVTCAGPLCKHALVWHSESSSQVKSSQVTNHL